MPEFQLVSDFAPTGDQPQAIEALVHGVEGADRYQTLKGVTGSGKTFVMANIIQAVQRPTLVIAHNKTLAAQLYSEFREFFPNNAVAYFVSYYDYYQPEAYLPRTDTYIEKDAQINEEIDRMRLAATSALFSRRDVIIVASVSCIYGLGDPEAYGQVVIELAKGEVVQRNKLLRHLVSIFYERNDAVLSPGRFRVRGDTIEVMLAYAQTVYRLEFWGDVLDRMTEVDALTGELLSELSTLSIYPAKHFITPQERLGEALEAIEAELEIELVRLRNEEKLLEAQRLEQRTRYDIEMLREMGYCSGIENYSRHLSQRQAGEPPWTLLDYFPSDYLMFIDESHMTVPQVRGMYNGDRARKQVLVDYGFRLPSAMDNRPLTFEEFEDHVNQCIFVSATPREYEEQISARVVEQVVRPTGLVDPEVVVRPIQGQIDDLIRELRMVAARGERALVTTLTKRMAEDLSDYLAEAGFNVHYLHSEVVTIERVEILRDLRSGVYDVIVGVNLLREGLDLPEVSLVAILDADKEGFLRSDNSLVQTIGRAARNVNGRVIMYADVMTDSMRRAIDETDRRREIQVAYNRMHDITPASIIKEIYSLTNSLHMAAEDKASYKAVTAMPPDEAEHVLSVLEEEMKASARNLEFEKAALIRDQILELRRDLRESDSRPEWERYRELDKKRR
ncbi:MAG: excinuclease ABC subunit UvrB [Anaerolineae bacterium]